MEKSELECKWHFASINGGSDTGPNNSTEESFKKEPYESLVRESIQNSLDAARDNNEPVRVDFRWKSINETDYPGLFSIREHFQECIKFWDTNDARDKYEPKIAYIDEKAKGGMFCLEVSDSNTTGMDYVPNDRRCSFYSFLRSVGNSNKSTVNAGGSHGFGKAAYYALSKINTMMVSTKTPEGKNFFEGVAYISTHEFEGEKRCSVGYYDNNEGEPISDAERIPVRFRREEPGTSVYIVGVEQNEALEEIVTAVLTHFWLSIMERKLVVNIERNNEGSLFTEKETLEINADTLEGLIYKFFKDEQDNIRGHSNPRPYFEAVKLAGTDKRHILVKENLPNLGEVRFYVNRDKYAMDRISYMRSPRMLVCNRTNSTGYGFYGVFICDDEKGNKFLRYTENGAHSEWDWKNAPNNYKEECRKVLNEKQEFIDETLVRLFSSKNAAFLNIDGLDQLLYIPTAYEENDEADSESATGHPTGEVQDEGTSCTSEIGSPESDPQPAPAENTSVGQVLVRRLATAVEDENGDRYTGTQTKKRHLHHGPKPDTDPFLEPKSELPKKLNKDTDDEDKGRTGNYSCPVDVTYRSFAQVEDGTVYHIIVIHSEIEIMNGQVVIFTGGEQGDERIRVVETNIGTVNENTVDGIQLHVGKNRLKIRLADDMKHAIRLEAYENK